MIRKNVKNKASRIPVPEVVVTPPVEVPVEAPAEMAAEPNLIDLVFKDTLVLDKIGEINKPEITDDDGDS